MRSNDIINQQRAQYSQQMQQALRDNNAEAFAQAFDGMCAAIGEDVRQEYDQRFQQMQEEMDSRVLTARGVRQLTTEERSYYGKLLKAMQSADPRQAVTGMPDILPRTVVESVFEDLRTNHPLLSHINFMPVAGAVDLIMNTDGYQQAAWGDLTETIVKELTGGFKKVSTNLLKLSAFLPVCKSMLDLGPEWIDRYVRECLYEALANGLEYGIIDGTGKKMPIGMTRQVGEGVQVTDGVYPMKEAIPIEDLSTTTVGDLLARLAVAPNGKIRSVQDVLLIVNPVDDLQKVMPATTLMGPDGTYRKDVLPYPMTKIPSPAVPQGKALIGLGKRYFASVGTAKEGKIDYSDHYRFLEDERVYLIKAYANGEPKDNTSFLLLDIENLQPAVWLVQQVAAAATAASADDGYNEGYAEGYNEGYAKGVSEGNPNSGIEE